MGVGTFEGSLKVKIFGGFIAEKGPSPVVFTLGLDPEKLFEGLPPQG